MARVTVEDCIKKIPNRFDLVVAAAQRSREIANGMPIEVERDNDKDPVVSLREIACDAVDHETLEDRFIKSMQKNIIREETSIEDDASLEDEFAAYLYEAKKETSSNDSLILNNNKIDDESSFQDISQTLLNDED
jgi:DNA-directed RNA polymerase subunit omega